MEMIRTTFTTAAAAAALLAISEPIDPPVAQADTVKAALCVLSRHDDAMRREEFPCDFTQTMGAAYIDSNFWAFIFPHGEQDKTFTRQNTEDFIRWTREGEYTLTLFQSGKKLNEKGSF